MTGIQVVSWVKPKAVLSLASEPSYCLACCSPLDCSARTLQGEIHYVCQEYHSSQPEVSAALELPVHFTPKVVSFRTSFKLVKKIVKKHVKTKVSFRLEPANHVHHNVTSETKVIFAFRGHAIFFLVGLS
ncbi:hypothetical protein MRX96_043689 [Rhipicephalus microplus]